MLFVHRYLISSRSRRNNILRIDGKNLSWPESNKSTHFADIRGPLRFNSRGFRSLLSLLRDDYNNTIIIIISPLKYYFSISFHPIIIILLCTIVIIMFTSTTLITFLPRNDKNININFYNTLPKWRPTKKTFGYTDVTCTLINCWNTQKIF